VWPDRLNREPLRSNKGLDLKKKTGGAYRHGGGGNFREDNFDGGCGILGSLNGGGAVGL